MHINDSHVIIEFNEHYLFQEMYEWITINQPRGWQVLKVMIVNIHVKDMTSCSPFDITKRVNSLSYRMLLTVKLHGVTSQKI